MGSEVSWPLCRCVVVPLCRCVVADAASVGTDAGSIRHVPNRLPASNGSLIEESQKKGLDYRIPPQG